MTDDRQRPPQQQVPPAGTAGVGDRQLHELLGAMASDRISPGAGAAGAIALALAAACAGKAVVITLKRHPADAALLAAREKFADIGRRALGAADEDAKRFEEFTHSKDPQAAARLVQAGKGLQKLAAALAESLNEIAGRIDPVMRGDLIAARALCAACVAIDTENLEENRHAADSVSGSQLGC